MSRTLRRVPLTIPRCTVALCPGDQLVGVEMRADEVVQLIVLGDGSLEGGWYEVVHVPVDVPLEVDDARQVEVAGTYLQSGYRLTAVCVLGRALAAITGLSAVKPDDADEEDDTDDEEDEGDSLHDDADVEAVARQPRRKKNRGRPRAAASEAKPAADDGPSLTERILTAIRGAAPVKLPGKTIAHLLQSHPGSTALRISALVRGGRLIEEQEGGMVVLCEPIAKPVATMPEVDAGMSPTSDFAPDEL